MISRVVVFFASLIFYLLIAIGTFTAAQKASSDTSHVTYHKAIERLINFNVKSCVHDVKLELSPLHVVNEKGEMIPGAIKPTCESKRTLVMALNFGGETKIRDGIEYKQSRKRHGDHPDSWDITNTGVLQRGDEEYWFFSFPGEYEIDILQAPSSCDDWELHANNEVFTNVPDVSSRKISIIVDRVGVQTATFIHNGCDYLVHAVSVWRL